LLCTSSPSPSTDPQHMDIRRCLEADEEEEDIDSALPPYEPAEREFDQKLADAVQQSLTINSQPDEEDWEEWDEAKFSAAQTSSRTGSSTSYPPEKLPTRSTTLLTSTSGSSHRPLPVTPPVHRPTKDRPSWFHEAHLPGAHDGGAVATHESGEPSPHRNSEEYDSPPPPFSVPPEGPRYVVPAAPQYGSSRHSPPIDNPSPRHRLVRLSPPPLSQLDTTAMVQDRRIPHRQPPKLHTTTARPAPINFNPLMAYTKENVDNHADVDPSAYPTNAASFYSSAVSAHLAPRPSTRPTASAAATHTPSRMSSHPRFPPETQNMHGSATRHDTMNGPSLYGIPGPPRPMSASHHTGNFYSTGA